MNTQEISQKKIEAVIEEFGGVVVSSALDIVNLSDPDAAYATLEDNGMIEEAAVVAALYF